MSAGLVLLATLGRSTPFLPPVGKAWLFAGQDVDAVESYVRTVGMPAGVTTYTDLKSLGGLEKRAEYGAGPIEADLYRRDRRFRGRMLAIGLYLVGDTVAVAAGERDAQITRLGRWIKRFGSPVLLRIGYEFDGPWNSYPAEPYRKAFVRIVHRLRALGVRNFATVWQSAGVEPNEEAIRPWYPGDEVVDWLGYSYFDIAPNLAGKGILAMARARRKPVFVAELTPKGVDVTLPDGPERWLRWADGFFAHMRLHPEIRAASYIYARWEDQAMWKGGGWGDSRLAIAPQVLNRWRKELGSGHWIHGPLVSRTQSRSDQ